MSNIDPESLARLRELAEKATPGPWYGDVTPPGPSGSVARNEAVITAERLHVARRGLQKSAQWWRDASFIADANPATILALLDEVERLRGCMHVAGLQCFMRGGAPEAVAAHMRAVASSREAEVERLRAENEKLAAENKSLRSGAVTIDCTGDVLPPLQFDEDMQ